MPEPVTCRVCGAKNPEGVQFCESCGVEIVATTRGKEEPEIDKLLESLTETKAGEAGAEGLDLDKEIVDELLDSLLVEEAPAEHFDCPLCGTKLPMDSKMCTKCGATFAAVAAPGRVQVETPPATEAPEAPTSPPEPAPTTSGSEEPVAVAVTDTDVSNLRVRSGKLIDIVVLGTIAALGAVFAAFQMWQWSSIAQNPGSLMLFIAVGGGGLAAGLIFFRMSTSAIAQGDQLVKDGRYEDALYFYDRAIRMGSKPASAWTSKGVALKRLNRLNDALRCHTIALKLDPENEIASCNQGDIYFRAGKLDRAIECYDKAIEIRPKYAIAWNNKGAALARSGRFKEARRCHDQAVTLKPKYVAAWLNRGEVLARLGLREEAEKSLEHARALTG